ncbi:MAG: NAD(P)-dependent oxidoreductase [Acidimicrobiales bacterium]|jgi:3-hydroxyisobutyrate dehydrogenase
MTDGTPKLAVLGLGTMGRAMAASALRHGIPTVVWNRNPEAARGVVEEGAEFASSAADAVRGVDVVITMVTDTAAVTSVSVDLGMLEALPAGAVWAQMSTIGVVGTAAIRSIAEGRRPDVLFLDAPVSGSKVPAEQGNLVIFASGSEQARPMADPIFDAIGKRTVWLGPVGMGSRMKLVNNTLLAFRAEGVANSLALAHRLGLDVHSVRDAFEGGPLISTWMAGKLSRIEDDDYSPEFPLGLALKDVRLALEEADPQRFRALDALAREWDDMVEQGLGAQDVTVVTRSLEG